jgi:hypothetical protein
VAGTAARPRSGPVPLGGARSAEVSLFATDPPPAPDLDAADEATADEPSDASGAEATTVMDDTGIGDEAAGEHPGPSRPD